MRGVKNACVYQWQQNSSCARFMCRGRRGRVLGKSSLYGVSPNRLELFLFFLDTVWLSGNERGRVFNQFLKLYLICIQVGYIICVNILHARTVKKFFILLSNLEIR
ncbi:Hypothetical_protein [Hexamita inflata]|uniref:Hypothetical_protein n=1 Tax=Hexamita inflata TaxID=28002 RepID=A0AA86TKP2_9EUKA|nr:Hypothetical protein HINF_LOCUS3453 [Hexamita inflata]